MLAYYVQGGWFDAKGHGQSAPELTVELYGHLRARSPDVDLLRGKGGHRAVEGPSGHDAGEDVGPQDVAQALDQDGLELAARKQTWPRHPVVAAVVLAVGDYGEPRGVDLVAEEYLQRGEPVPEEHFERRKLEGQPAQVALQAWRHGAYHFRVEAYPGHTGEAALGSSIVCGDAEVHPGEFAFQYAPAGSGRVERKPELPRQHVRRAE